MFCDWGASYSRRHLLEALIPHAGKSSKSKNVKKTEGENKGNSKARYNIQQDLCGERPWEIIMNFLLLNQVFISPGTPQGGSPGESNKPSFVKEFVTQTDTVIDSQNLPPALLHPPPVQTHQRTGGDEERLLHMCLAVVIPGN